MANIYKCHDFKARTRWNFSLAKPLFHHFNDDSMGMCHCCLQQVASDTATTQRPDDSLAKEPDETFLTSSSLLYLERHIHRNQSKQNRCHASCKPACVFMKGLALWKKFKVMWRREQAMERDDSQDGSAAKYHWFYESGLEKKCFLSETKGINLLGFFCLCFCFAIKISCADTDGGKSCL